MQEDQDQTKTRMKRILSTNLFTANFMIDSEERSGIFSRTAVFCKNLLPQFMARNFGFVLAISFIIIRLMVAPILPYYDFIADLSLTTTMHHIHENFITSESKARAVSYINLDINGYYFFLLNPLSMGIMALFCWNNFPIIKNCKESILFSVLTLTSNRGANFLALLYALFPYHTLAFELTNFGICRIKRQQSIKALLNQMIEKNEKENDDNDIRSFLRQQRDLETTYVNESKVNRILVGCGLIVMLFESIPQLIVLLSLLRSELTNGFGKLGVLMENVMHTYLRSLGVPKDSTFIMIMIINIAQICISLIAVISSRRYGLDLGIIGGLLKLLSILIMLSSKIILLTLQLYQTPYFFTLVVVAELAISYLFCKITQTQVDVMEDVIPIAVSTALYVTANRKIRHQENPNSKFHYFLKWNGVFSIVILHFTNLFLIYLPINYVFPAFQTKIGQRIEKNYDEKMYATIAYCCTILPFLWLMLAYHKLGRRWAKLEA